MLGDLERKIASVVADSVTTHTHLAVGVAPMDLPAAGRGTVAVSLSALTPQTGFAPADITVVMAADKAQSRRILPLHFKAIIAFFQRPAAENAAAGADARALMLEDISTVAHTLGDPTFLAGTAFEIAAPDPGFRVLHFQLETGTILAGTDSGHYTGALGYEGRADVWPAGVQADQGVVRTLDTIIAPLPLAFTVQPERVRPGAATTVTAAAPGGRRLTDLATNTRQNLRLAVTVLSDVPPAQRGTITAGTAGDETGLRIMEVTGANVRIPYQAPAGNPGPAGRTEYVAVHLATPAGSKGLFLGSAAIRLVGGP